MPKNFRGQENQQDRYNKHHHMWKENSHPNTIYRQNRQPENRYQDNGHRHQDNGHRHQDNRHGLQDMDTYTTNIMITRILAKHHMEFTAKNILTNLIIYKITRGQIA